MNFVRTRFDVQAYLIIGYWSYLLNALGPLTPFLRDELNLSYTVASFHFSAFALGMMLMSAGAINPLLRRTGAKRMVWGAMAGMALGALLLILGRTAVLTVPGAFLMGFLGVPMIIVCQGAIANEHGEERAIALAETAVMGSLFASLSPLALGFFSRTPLTWRAAMVLGMLIVPALWLAYRAEPIRAGNDRPGAKGAAAPLPFTYWIYWVLILIAVAIEFCTIFWGADFLEKVVGFARPDAALAMSVFMGSMLVGRVTFSRLLRRISTSTMLFLSLALAAAGFLCYWLLPVEIPALKVPLALLGLVLAGTGTSGLYPMISALGLAVSEGRTVQATANYILAQGISLLSLPLLLGSVADVTGIRAAYGLEGALIVIAAALAVVGNRRGASLMSRRDLHTKDAK